MIQLSGTNLQQLDTWPPGSLENLIVQQMYEDSAVYSYSSMNELSFELALRKNIVRSAHLMNESEAHFATFTDSRCNPYYWQLTSAGGFLLRHGVQASEAIEDIYRNSSLYAFECATATIIIYYHALLNSIGAQLFNQIFPRLYLYSWHADPDLGLKTVSVSRFLPGDVVYFKNPDFSPQTPWWRGENAVVLEDGAFFGHGAGIRTADQMIQSLNRQRVPGSNQSAYLLPSATRPAFKHLAQLAITPRNNSDYKLHITVIHHNRSSISFNRYVTYLRKVYNQAVPKNPFS